MSQVRFVSPQYFKPNPLYNLQKKNIRIHLSLQVDSDPLKLFGNQSKEGINVGMKCLLVKKM